MKIAVSFPVINQKALTQEVFNHFKASQGGEIQYVIVDNGSDEFVRDWLLGLNGEDIVIRNGLNEGVIKAYNQVWQVLKNTDVDYIFYTHNDVMMFEKNWDLKLAEILERENKIRPVGVAGFYGAKGIGTPNIYKAPYAMEQMIRLENVSNANRMDKLHGYRNIRGGADVEDVAVQDGFSLIVKMDLLNKIGGFDRTFPPHHMYDNDICLESLDKGYRNIVIAMDVQHLGGRTDVNEDWSKPFGKTKQEIHQDAHPIFYEKWKPGKHSIHLPVRIQ